MAGVYLTEDSLPDASDMLFYFLNQTRNTDGKYTSFSTLDMLEDNEAENQYSRLIEEVNEAMDAIEYLLLENELDNIAFCQIEQNTSDEFAGTQGTNGVFSVNNYRTWIEGVAVCDGDEFEATLYYNVEDYYNWDPALDYGESLGNFILNVAVSNLWQFNWCGLARNYFASGDVVEINISWSLGDRFNDNSLLDMSIY